MRQIDHTTRTSRQFHVHIAILALLLITIFFIGVHSEMIIARDYAPAAVLLYAPNAQVCVAEMKTLAIASSTMTLTPLKNIYDYLDAAKFTVTREAGYFLLETGLVDYNGNYSAVVTCRDTAGMIQLVVTFSADRPLNCSSFNRGRLVIC